MKIISLMNTFLQLIIKPLLVPLKQFLEKSVNNNELLFISLDTWIEEFSLIKNIKIENVKEMTTTLRQLAIPLRIVSFFYIKNINSSMEWLVVLKLLSFP